MQRLFLRIAFSISLISTIAWGCTKIDTTVLGADLIPAVDNVHTFADTLEVVGTQGLLTQDTSKIGVNDLQVLGNINNDPLFGKTKANIYLQLKPSFFPYYFGNAKDSISPSLVLGTGFDSVVLCLAYNGFYGDSAQPQTIRVMEMNTAETNFKFDSIYQTNYQPAFTPSTLLGQVTVLPTDLAKYRFLKTGKDSVNYQIRIPLNVTFFNKLFNNYDSSANKTFHSDSLFTSVFKGFAIEANGGSSSANGLFYISLTDAKTRLEVHYRRKNIAAIDTAFSSWSVIAASTSVVKKSATANYINRNREGSQYASHAPDALFVQTAPGTFATLKIPALDTLSNRIIHRAELIVEQIPAMNPLLPSPNYLYLDAVDTGLITKYKPIPFDLSPNSGYNPNTSVMPFFPTNGIDFAYYGGYLKTKTDVFSGQSINYYAFNLSRYVQNIVTTHNINYPLRLSAPYNLFYYGYSLPFNNKIANGGIKVGNGNNAHYKLRMRIVYSKI